MCASMRGRWYSIRKRERKCLSIFSVRFSRRRWHEYHCRHYGNPKIAILHCPTCPLLFLSLSVPAPPSLKALACLSLFRGLTLSGSFFRGGGLAPGTIWVGFRARVRRLRGRVHSSSLAAAEVKHYCKSLRCSPGSAWNNWKDTYWPKIDKELWKDLKKVKDSWSMPGFKKVPEQLPQNIQDNAGPCAEAKGKLEAKLKKVRDQIETAEQGFTFGQNFIKIAE